MEHWHNIRTERDIEFLMSTYGGFHDSCIVSFSFQNGAFVDDKGAMHFSDAASRRLSVIFKSQWKPRTIELQFSVFDKCISLDGKIIISVIFQMHICRFTTIYYPEILTVCLYGQIQIGLTLRKSIIQSMNRQTPTLWQTL